MSLTCQLICFPRESISLVSEHGKMTVKYWKKRLFPKHLQTLASLLGLLPLRSKVKENSWERDNKKKPIFFYI